MTLTPNPALAPVTRAATLNKVKPFIVCRCCFNALVLTVLFCSSYSHSHTPISESLLMGNSETTGGYGYIPGRSGESEASSLRLFSDSCDTYCEIDPVSSSAGIDSDVLDLVETVEQDAIVRRLREKVLEMKMLKLGSNPELFKAFHGDYFSNMPEDLLAIQIDDLASVRSFNESYQDTGVARIASCMFSEPADPELGFYIGYFGVNRFGGNKILTNIGSNKKFSATSAKTSLRQNMQAVIWNDFLEQAKDYYQHFPDNIALIEEQQKRLHESYSDLFGEIGEEYRYNLKRGIHRLMGVQDPSSIFGRDNRRFGELSYNNFIRTQRGIDYPDLVDQLFEKLDQIEAANLNEGNQFINQLDKINVDFNIARLNKDSEDVSSICGLNFQEIVSQYPNVIRQVMLDSEESDRNMLFSLLCKYNLKDNFTPTRICGKMLDHSIQKD